MYDELNGVELTELHVQQVAWAAEQAASLQEYFNSQGKHEVIEAEWPIVLVD
jgi:DNA polymerase-3 subunit epsilon